MGELKEQALLERIGQLIIQYEDRVADLRVELTLVSNELTAANQRHDDISASSAPPESEVLEGTVVV